MYKYLLLIGLISVSEASSVGWRKIAKTVECPYEVTIEAKDGEKSIRVLYKQHPTILFPQGNYVFMTENSIPLEYDSYNRKDSSMPSRHFKYTRTVGGSGQSDELVITNRNKKIQCRVQKI
jgi:hypothetical protein